MSRTRYVDGRRALRGGVLAAWAAFFTWLWVTGEIARYLGPRTYWVVPFGALLLGAAALMHVVALRVVDRRPRPSTMDVVGAVMLIVPLIAVGIVPSAKLGSLAASRKSTAASFADVGSPAVTGPIEPIENPTFRDIAYAEQSERYAITIGLEPGRRVELLGFVDDEPDGPEGTFQLTRFYVSCCAADAIPYSTAIDPPGSGPAEFPDDVWVRAAGKLERRGDRLVVVADQLERVPEPEKPYLY
jgi:putative membrane protein